MSAVKDAALKLESALRTVPEVEVLRQGDPIDKPSLVLAAPSLVYDSYQSGPTSAQFIVFAVVQADELAVEQLWDLVLEVSEAVDAYSDAVVTRADPVSYPVNAGSETKLPAYEITVEAPL